MAEIRAAQGHLRQAFRSYQQLLALVADYSGTVIRGTADLYLGLSELYREWNDMVAAAQQLQVSQELGEPAKLPSWQHRSRMAAAQLKQAQGDWEGAINLLDQAERVYYRSPLPDIQPISALKARIWVQQGRTNEALNWISARGLSLDDEPAYLREFEHLTLARILIAQYRQDKPKDSSGSIQGVSALLKRLLIAAQAADRLRSTIEILMLQALLKAAQDDLSVALDRLGQALTLAEPEGYVRLFVYEGEPMAALLQEAVKQGIAPAYVSQLRSAFSKADSETPVIQHLDEPLSDRELEVLKLLGTELSGPEIAAELMVSLNTVRTHTKNIYSKLGANSRRAAVRRAGELGLL